MRSKPPHRLVAAWLLPFILALAIFSSLLEPSSSITIVNPLAHTKVGGNWTIYFSTTGSGNLVIEDHSFPEDVEFVGLYADVNGESREVPVTIIGDKILADWNYQTGKVIFKVKTQERHTLEIKYASSVTYAYSEAEIRITLNAPSFIGRTQEFTIEGYAENHDLSEVSLVYVLPEGFELVRGERTKYCGSGGNCSSDIAVIATNASIGEHIPKLQACTYGICEQGEIVISVEPVEIEYGEPRQDDIILGQPVPWSMSVILRNSESHSIINYTVPLPAGALNISQPVIDEINPGETMGFNIHYYTPAIKISRVNDSLRIYHNSSFVYHDILVSVPVLGNVTIYENGSGELVNATIDRNIASWIIPELMGEEAFIIKKIMEEEPIIIQEAAQPRSRRHFKANEKPSFKVNLTRNQSSDSGGNATTTPPSAWIEDVRGKKVGLTMDVNYLGGGNYKIDVPNTRAFKPGKFKLVVESDNGMEELWFDWGLISINTKKSLYHPGETAEIIMVVLDNEGYLVSSANVSLVMTSPNGTVSNFSTLNGDMTETKRGIYEVTHETVETGNYTINASAKARGVESSIDSYFVVKEYYEFDINRSVPVTIDPQEGPFDSKIKIISYTDAENLTLREYLPAEFDVNVSNVTITIINDTKILEWSNLTNGSEVNYRFNTPLVWP